ncbi:MAG TPA: GMC family oxidoreductase N-terminal domain-containing protein, partial [Nocardioidaceae bacterium]
MAPDVIVVGGGTAGCVVAAILSEDPACEVLLLEAGPDFPTVADLPADVANGAEPTVNHDWGFVAERNAWGREIALPRAKLVGGCSATNAAFWFRGWPADYDGWAAAGNPGWSYDDLLPTMQALGSVPLTHVSEVELAPLQSAFIEAALAAGQAAVDDHNRPGPVGVGPMTRNTRDGVRMSTAQTH